MRTEIDFLSEKDKITPQPKRQLGKISKLVIYLLVIFGIIFTVYSVNIIASGENLSQTFGNVSLFGQIKRLISSDDKKLTGEETDRINILLLGMGGENHDGPYLTDTIMVASVKPSTKQVALISIPRDLLVPIPGYGWRKINNANAFGEVYEDERGGELAAEVVSQVLNLPIHYYLRVDFAGFVDIIDILGGISVEVENTLDDPSYPIKGKENATTSERYEHLYIESGKQKFDGPTALKFVRSRQAIGIEGSDFARSQRQQKVLVAVKDKALSFSTLANPIKINRLLDTLSQHLATNLEVWELLRLYGITKNIGAENITNRVFDDSPNGPLYAGFTEDGAFVLRPNAGNFSELQNIANNIFDPEALARSKPRPIEIQNGTKVEGLAYRTSQYLQSLGYQVIRLKNAPTQDYQKTVIYNLNQDQDPNNTVENLHSLLNVEVSPSLPSWVTATTSNEVSNNADILIILGADRAKLWNNYLKL